MSVSLLPNVPAAKAGDLVSVAGIVGTFAGFRAVADAEMHRPAQAGMVWVREVRGLIARPRGWVPFTIEWPVSKVVPV